MPEVSVILPIYNTSKYLDGLFDTMLNQTFKDIEIICVDDGSKDNSAEIIKYYAQKDERIKYYYQENSGGGAARNFGLTKAEGKYVIWLDSDDIYEKELIEKLHSQAIKTNAEITICKYKIWNQTTDTYSNNKGINAKVLPDKEVFSSEDTEDILGLTVPAPSNKLYLRSFVIETGLKYSTTKIINDLKFYMTIFLLAKRITTVEEELLTYRYQTESSVSKNREQKLEASLKVYGEIYEEFLKRGIWEKHKKSFFNQISSSLNYELSFPVSDGVLKKIGEYLSKAPFEKMTKEEKRKFLNTNKMKKHVFEYTYLNIITLGLSKSIKEKYISSKTRVNNLKKLGILGQPILCYPPPIVSNLKKLGILGLVKTNLEYLYRHLKKFDLIKEIGCFIVSNIKPFGDRKFTTILITRFNYGNNPKGIEEEYLEKRIEIFDKYTFPSINSQTDKDFIWVILLNSKTPEKYKSIIERYKNIATMNLIILWVECEQQVPNIGELLKRTIEISNKYILTMRCDNDDMLAKNYIEEMKKNFLPVHNMYIDFIYGYSFDISEKILNSYKCRSNHFIGYVENLSERPLQTVYNYDHSMVKLNGWVRRIKNQTYPLWCEISHQLNEINTLRGDFSNENEINYFKANFKMRG